MFSPPAPLKGLSATHRHPSVYNILRKVCSMSQLLEVLGISVSLVDFVPMFAFIGLVALVALAYVGGFLSAEVKRAR